MGRLLAVILNLGVGLKVMAGAVNVDKVAAVHVDEVWDLNEYPWPWESGAASEIHAAHIFEHIIDPLSFMAEAHRVLEVGGLLHIEAPHYKSQNAFTDPTHRRFVTEDTFRYWVPDNWLSNMTGEMYHRNCLFDEVSNEVVSGDLRVVLRKR